MDDFDLDIIEQVVEKMVDMVIVADALRCRVDRVRVEGEDEWTEDSELSSELDSSLDDFVVGDDDTSGLPEETSHMLCDYLHE